MKVLLLGVGGREHTIAWKVKQSNLLEKLFIAPGNAGTRNDGENVSLDIGDFSKVKQFVLDNRIEMVIVGPEQPLMEGIVDFFKQDKGLNQVLILGPSKAAARLEGSKDFAKKFMNRYQIPTASSRSFNKEEYNEAIQFLNKINPPYVIKADGLASGKGVMILNDVDKAGKTLKEMLVDEKFGDASRKVVIEEFLSGIECSVFALTDGNDYMILPTAKDYKRIGEADTGLNTGGMGCVSPVPFAGQKFMASVEEKIIKPTMEGLKKENLDYKGFIYFGLMNVDDHPYVVEYNVRMGDPEAQVVLPRLRGDFLEQLIAAVSKNLKDHNPEITEKYALSVIAASGGYPGKHEKSKVIYGLDEVDNAWVFHAGTKIQGNTAITSGGRVLAVTALAEDLSGARKVAYDNIKRINFEKIYYRRDIGKDLIE